MKTDWRRAWRGLTPRVVLGFAALTAALMVACGVYLYQALRLELGARDRDEQRGKIVLFRQALAGVSDAGMLRRNPDWLTHFMVGHDGLALRVLDARAAVLVDSPAALPPGLWRGLDETPARLSGHDAHGHPWQGLAARATLADGQAVQLEIWRDGHDQEALLAQYRNHLLWAGALATLVAAALGGALVRHSLRPLAALTAAAMAIRPDTLNQRLDASLAPAELLGLVNAFNDALARLDAAFARLSDYAADLAHEMRTPLGILLGQTQVALSRGRSLAEYQQVLADNAEELERLARTVNDLLFLAKTEHSEAALACEWLDVRQEVDEVCEFFALLAEERDIQVQVAGALRLPVARAALRRLLNNLLSNAIRYSPPGSVVRVALDARLPGVVVNNPPAAPLPEPLTMLFERFYSQGDGNGHGLGLPIARAIARQHGGELRASLGDDGRLTLAAQLAASASLVQARRCS